MRERNQIASGMEAVLKLEADVSDALELIELAEADGDAAMVAEGLAALRAAAEEAKRREIESLLSGEADSNDCYIELNAGAGGTEAQDWAEMLMRMYTRWAEKHGYKAALMEESEGEQAGIKSATLQIEGDYVYGYLKGESGVHRLVRISPFDSNARRHTSFASVFIFPILDESIEVDIRPEDLRIDTYRSGGAGGQKVNKTDSAVRMTHLPTGIVVTCQNERSQYKNKDVAMSVLKSRLYEYYKLEKEKENAKFASEKKEIAWGSQIRSYVFQPYTMVKDHRNKFAVGNVQAVMDGDIDPFIESYMRWKWQGGASGAAMGDEAEDEDL
jgi:peptide chain release factor 2